MAFLSDRLEEHLKSKVKVVGANRSTIEEFGKFFIRELQSEVKKKGHLDMNLLRYLCTQYDIEAKKLFGSYSEIVNSKDLLRGIADLNEGSKKFIKEYCKKYRIKIDLDGK